MRVLKTNEAQIVTVGPFIDVTDGFTPITSLTAASVNVTFSADILGVPTLRFNGAANATGGADHSLIHITADTAGFFAYKFAAADLQDGSTNKIFGRAIISFNNSAVFLPVFHEFQILATDIYESLVVATELLQVNVQEINTDAAAADALDANIAFLDVAVSSVGGGSSAGAIADAVWDEARAGHVAAGTFGEGVASVQGAVASVVDEVAANVTAIDSDAAAATRLGVTAKQIHFGYATGTPTSTTIQADNVLAGNPNGNLLSTTDIYKGRLLTKTSGAGAGEARTILGYDGTTLTFTTEPFAIAFSADDALEVV